MLSTMPKAMNGRVPGPGKHSQFWPLALLPSLWEIPSLALPSQTAHLAFLFLPDPKLQSQALILPMVFGLMEGDTSLFCRRRDTGEQKAEGLPCIPVTSGGDPVTAAQNDFLPKPWLGGGCLRGVVP